MLKDKRSINNAFYEDLYEKWYEESSHPVALLRAENQARNPWILQKIKELKGEKCQILDIGCGAGFLTNELARQGHQVTGVDCSESSLLIAQRYDETNSVSYLKKDAFALDFQEKSFDVICAMDFLEHIEDPEQIIKRVSFFLKKGGIFFFHTFNRNFLSWLMVIKAVEWLVPNTPKNMHLYRLFIKPQELKKWLNKAEFELREIYGLAPCFTSSFFWKSLLQRKVDPHFRFKLTPSLASGYLGYSQLTTDQFENTAPL